MYNYHCLTTTGCVAHNPLLSSYVVHVPRHPSVRIVGIIISSFHGKTVTMVFADLGIAAFCSMHARDIEFMGIGKNHEYLYP